MIIRIITIISITIITIISVAGHNLPFGVCLHGALWPPFPKGMFEVQTLRRALQTEALEVHSAKCRARSPLSSVATKETINTIVTIIASITVITVITSTTIFTASMAFFLLLPFLL